MGLLLLVAAAVDLLVEVFLEPEDFLRSLFSPPEARVVALRLLLDSPSGLVFFLLELLELLLVSSCCPSARDVLLLLLDSSSTAPLAVRRLPDAVVCPLEEDPSMHRLDLDLLMLRRRLVDPSRLEWDILVLRCDLELSWMDLETSRLDRDTSLLEIDTSVV